MQANNETIRQEVWTYYLFLDSKAITCGFPDKPLL